MFVWQTCLMMFTWHFYLTFLPDIFTWHFYLTCSHTRTHTVRRRPGSLVNATWACNYAWRVANLSWFVVSLTQPVELAPDLGTTDGHIGISIWSSTKCAEDVVGAISSPDFVRKLRCHRARVSGEIRQRHPGLLHQWIFGVCVLAVTWHGNNYLTLLPDIVTWCCYLKLIPEVIVCHSYLVGLPDKGCLRVLPETYFF